MVSSTVHGRSDTWVKWSFGTDGFAPWVDAIVSSEPTWVTAHKERMLRKFDLDGDMVAEVPIDQRPVDGCNVELVRLAVGRDVWWTFGFESFGPRERVRANLLTVLSHWFKTPAPVSLDTTNSVPYSAWAAGALI